MLIDTHAHLDQSEFDSDRDEVIARAREAGISAIVAVGVSADSSWQSVRLAETSDLIHAAVGIQPNYCHEASPTDWQRIVELARHPRVVAIGETGLDGHWGHCPIELQRDYFDRHLQLSHDRKLPFIVHMRSSAVGILDMLRERFERRGPLTGVMHSFTIDRTLGDPPIRRAIEMAAECVEMGLYISFAGMVTFKKSDDLREVAATIRTDRILVETDSPYLSPHPLRGKRNEPGRVVHTARTLAEVRGRSPEEFAEETTANARRLFGLA